MNLSNASRLPEQNQENHEYINYLQNEAFIKLFLLAILFQIKPFFPNFI